MSKPGWAPLVQPGLKHYVTGGESDCPGCFMGPLSKFGFVAAMFAVAAGVPFTACGDGPEIGKDAPPLNLTKVLQTPAGASVKWEESRGGQLFPHVYGAMPLEVVVAYGPLERDNDNNVKLPVAG